MSTSAYQMSANAIGLWKLIKQQLVSGQSGLPNKVRYEMGITVNNGALRPSQVVAVMREGQQYRQKDMVAKLDRSVDVVRKVLVEMVAAGTIKARPHGNSKIYSLPKSAVEPAPVTPTRYKPEWKELGIVDLTRFQRECEEARNPEKGMV